MPLRTWNEGSTWDFSLPQKGNGPTLIRSHGMEFGKCSNQGSAPCDAEQDRAGLARNLTISRQIIILITYHILDNNIPKGTSSAFKLTASHMAFLESHSQDSFYKPK